MTTYKNTYFIGIGGIGMSALARYFNQIGKNVLGYDKTTTVLTKSLEKEGIAIHYEEDIETIKKVDPRETLFIYTPAIPATHKELAYLKANNIKVYKRSEVLGIIADTGKMYSRGRNPWKNHNFFNYCTYFIALQLRMQCLHWWNNDEL